jgi:hypothetical protein
VLTCIGIAAGQHAAALWGAGMHVEPGDDHSLRHFVWYAACWRCLSAACVLSLQCSSPGQDGALRYACVLMWDR